jgi:hypothetical protein
VRCGGGDGGGGVRIERVESRGSEELVMAMSSVTVEDGRET